MTLTENNVTNTDDTRIPTRAGPFLGPLSILVRQKRTWSPALLAGILWRTLTNIRTHREVIHLLRRPPLAEAAKKNPRFGIKYLTPHYLVRSFTLAERATCFLYHHRRMCAAFPDRLLRKILEGDVPVHQICVGNNCFSFSIGLSTPCDKEGELSLNLLVDDEIVFILSFTIVPGAVLGSPAREVLLVTRLQGTPGCYPKIKLATAALRDIGLNALLFSGLQGFACALGVTEIFASCASDQTSYDEALAAIFQRAYDDFYLDLGMTKTDSGFFVGTIPIEGKPLEQVKRSHKSRTKEQRRFKQEIQQAFADYFNQIIDRTAPALAASQGIEIPRGMNASPGSIPCSTLDHNPTQV